MGARMQAVLLRYCKKSNKDALGSAGLPEIYLQ